MTTTDMTLICEMIANLREADALGDVDSSDPGEVYDWVKRNYGKEIATDREIMDRLRIETQPED